VLLPRCVFAFPPRRNVWRAQGTSLIGRSRRQVGRTGSSCCSVIRLSVRSCGQHAVSLRHLKGQSLLLNEAPEVLAWIALPRLAGRGCLIATFGVCVVSAGEGIGELRDVTRLSAIRVHRNLVACTASDRTTTLLHPSGERDMFTSVADLRILSSALALFITRAGNRVRERPENPEVIRARQLMDHVDDRLYLPPPCSMTPVKPPREAQSPKHL
jgi:hypothetical protein